MSELRQKILERISAGDSPTAIAKRFNVSHVTIYNVKKVFEDTGSVENCPRSGRPRTACSATIEKEVFTTINANPSMFIQKLAREHNMAKTTMRRMVKKDLGLKSLSKQKVQMLTAKQRDKRVQRGKRIENFLKNGLDGKVLVFSDEKDFTVDQYLNRHSDHYISTSVKATDPTLKYVGTGKHPSKASMLGVIMSDGKALWPFWYEGSIDGTKYKQYLIQKVFPTLDATYAWGNYIWTQDGAPAHCHKDIQKYIKRRLGSKGFWPANMWPPLPNLNPLDFSIWAHVEKEACSKPHSNVDPLKSCP